MMGVCRFRHKNLFNKVNKNLLLVKCKFQLKEVCTKVKKRIKLGMRIERVEKIERRTSYGKC